MPYLYEDTYTTDSSRGSDTQKWHATMFRPNVDTSTPGARIYKPVQGTGASGHPDVARLYNFDTGTLIEELDVSGLTWPGNTQDGWVTFTWATAHTLSANVRYLIAYRNGSGQGWAYQSGAPGLPPGGSSFTVNAIGPASATTAYSGEVATSTLSAVSAFTWYSDHRNGADIYVGTDTPPASSAVTATDIDNELNTWLSSNDETNTHHAALPWATKVQVDDIQSRAAGASGFSAIKAVADAVSSAVGGLPGTIASAATSIITAVAADVASLAASTATALTSVSHDIASVENHLLDVVSGRAGYPTGTPNTTWALAASTDFDTQLAWAVQADMYLVSITAVRPGLGADTFAGLTWYHRLGSWCVLNGTLGSTRRFLEFEQQVCDDGGRRMAGLALRCQPGTIGTVQAWTLG